MGTVLSLILLAPLLLTAWAAPTVLRSIPLLVVVSLGVAGVGYIVARLTLGWPIEHELEMFSIGGVIFLVTIPLFYAFAVGALCQLVVLAFTRSDSQGERTLRLLSVAALFGIPAFLFLA
jgi:hypothetical protein